MRRIALLTLGVVGLCGCEDSSPTAAVSPELAKSGAGGVTVTSLVPAREGSAAEDVNDAGQVVLNTLTPQYTPLRAFLWRPAQPRGTTGTLEDLGTLGGAGAQVKAINNQGQAVGGSGDAAGIGRAFLWTDGGGMQDLGLAQDWTGAAAVDINESGQVAGYVSSGAGQRAAVWSVTVDAGGTVQVLDRENLGTLPDGGSSVSFGMNNLGQVAGYAYYPAAGPNRAVLWTRTATGWMIEDLGVFPGDNSSTAYGINDQGQVVGLSYPPQGCAHAILWSTRDGRKTGMRALETLGGCGAEAWGINNQGQVTGRSAPAHGGQEATLWTLALDGSTMGIQDLGRLSGTAFSLGIELSSTLSGTTLVAGLSQPTSGGLRATLWAVQK